MRENARDNANMDMNEQLATKGTRVTESQEQLAIKHDTGNGESLSERDGGGGVPSAMVGASTAETGSEMRKQNSELQAGTTSSDTRSNTETKATSRTKTKEATTHGSATITRLGYHSKMKEATKAMEHHCRVAMKWPAHFRRNCKAGANYHHSYNTEANLDAS